MSYDVAIWVGDRPVDDRAASREFDERMDAYEKSTLPVVPRISAFVADLVARHPEGLDEGVWSIEPVLGDASGDLAYLTMTFGGADRVLVDVAELALRHGLIAYDPQQECLLDSDEDPSEGPTIDVTGASTLSDLAEALSISTAKARRYAARIGAGDTVDFAQALTISLMHPDDGLVHDDQWLAVLETVREWWTSLPDLDTHCMLVVSGDQIALDTLPLGSAQMWELTGHVKQLTGTW